MEFAALRFPMIPYKHHQFLYRFDWRQILRVTMIHHRTDGIFSNKPQQEYVNKPRNKSWINQPVCPQVGTEPLTFSDVITT